MAIFSIILNRTYSSFCADQFPKQQIPRVAAGHVRCVTTRMTKINSFRDLSEWQVSMDLADVCFDIVEAIPYPYKFSFCDQLRRS